MGFNKALIIGCNGQDGTLLRLSLLQKNVQVIGISRSHIISYVSDLNKLEDEDTGLIILNLVKIKKLLSEYKPTEIYYLAAHHTSSEILEPETSEEYLKYHDAHVSGLLNILNIVRDLKINTKIFYASSALVFGGNNNLIPVSDNPIFSPIGYYGLTKSQGSMLCNYYKNKYSIYTSVGYLYNHESYLRSNTYLSKKIISGAYQIAKGEDKKLLIGNMSSVIDWGYAPDFVEAFQKIINLKIPKDYIVSTGEGRSVKDFISVVFSCFNLDYKLFIIEDSSIQKRNTPPRIGDSSKLFLDTGWRPTYTFNDMVKKLVNDHIENISSH